MEEKKVCTLIKTLGFPDCNGRIIPLDVMEKALQDPFVQENLKTKSYYLYKGNSNIRCMSPLEYSQLRIEDRLARIDNMDIKVDDNMASLWVSISSMVDKLPVEVLISGRDNARPDIHIRGFGKITKDNIVSDLYIISLDLFFPDSDGISGHKI